MEIPFAELTPAKFVDLWYRLGGELVQWPKEDLLGPLLTERTIEWLTNAGLPPAALPYVRFESHLVDSKKELGTILGAQYVLIGNCNDGDAIVIDLRANDGIYWLDSENNYTPEFFNSSVAQLLCALLLYREFVMDIKRTKGEEAYTKSEFTDVEFEKLETGLMLLDPMCLQQGSFWKIQLDMDLQLRREGRG